MANNLDRLDRHILRLLQQDASISIKDLAQAVKLTTTPCWKRIKRLEEQGYILSRVALLDPKLLELRLIVFVQLKTRFHDRHWLEDFVDVVLGFDEVVEFYRMSGEWDYMLRVMVKDMSAYDSFYKKLVEKTNGLTDVSSNFSMQQLKYTTALPLE